MRVTASSPGILAGRTVSGPVSARIAIDGLEYVNFFGAGYFALSGLPQVRDAVLRALQQGLPLARSTPAALGACEPLFDDVERLGAEACGTEASVYFASGYLIGAVALASLEHAFDLVVMDDAAHYSLQAAAKLYGRPTFTFAHCDADSLADTLRRHVRANQRPLVLTDGAFATTGRIPPLADYAEPLAAYDGRLVVDESHAFGVVGPTGRGAAEHCGVTHMTVSGATLSKAYCAQGAIVGCSMAAARRIRQVPPLGAANAGSPLSAAASAASLAYVAEHPELRTQLGVLGDYLRARLRNAGFEVIDSPAPIVSFRYGRDADMQALQKRAFDRGVHIYHSRYIGAGPEGMIRCAVFRDHSREDIDVLIDALHAREV